MHEHLIVVASHHPRPTNVERPTHNGSRSGSCFNSNRHSAREATRRPGSQGYNTNVLWLVRCCSLHRLHITFVPLIHRGPGPDQCLKQQRTARSVFHIPHHHRRLTLHRWLHWARRSNRRCGTPSFPEAREISATGRRRARCRPISHAVHDAWGADCPSKCTDGGQHACGKCTSSCCHIVSVTWMCGCCHGHAFVLYGLVGEGFVMGPLAGFRTNVFRSHKLHLFHIFVQSCEEFYLHLCATERQISHLNASLSSFTRVFRQVPSHPVGWSWNLGVGILMLIRRWGRTLTPD